MSLQVVTACKSAAETNNRIDDFLSSFRSELESMDRDTFVEHLVAIAKRKLEGFDSLEEETSSHWSEIVERRYDFEAYRKEVQCLRTLTKDEVITAYDVGFFRCAKRRASRQSVVDWLSKLLDLEMAPIHWVGR